MLNLKNKTFKIIKLGKWLVIIGMLTSVHTYTKSSLQTDPLILATIGALSFNKPEDMSYVINSILTDPTVDPLEILEHLETIGIQTSNKNIQKLVKYIKTLIIEITKKIDANKINNALNDAQMEVAIKGIILKCASNSGTLNLVSPVEKSLSSKSKQEKKQILDELEERIKNSKYHHKYFSAKN